MTLEQFQNYCVEYEENTGQPVTSMRIDRQAFDALVNDAQALATRRVKGPRLPRNQVMIGGVLVVAR